MVSNFLLLSISSRNKGRPRVRGISFTLLVLPSRPNHLLQTGLSSNLYPCMTTMRSLCCSRQWLPPNSTNTPDHTPTNYSPTTPNQAVTHASFYWIPTRVYESMPYNVCFLCLPNSIHLFRRLRTRPTLPPSSCIRPMPYRCLPTVPTD